MRYPLRMMYGVLCALPVTSLCFAQDLNSEAAASGWPLAIKVVLLLLPVLAILIGAYFYLRHLQQSYQQSCLKGYNLEVLSKSPLGLPEGTIGALLKLMAGVMLLYIIVVSLIMINIKGFPSLADLGGASGQISVKEILSGIGAVTFLILIIVGAVYYMQRLQTQFFNGCMKTNQIDIFFHAPAGLPDGTIRAVLALMIVAVSMFFIVFQFFIAEDQSAELPQGLMTLLTAVVAFYFAHRAGTQGTAASIAGQTQSLRDQRDTAIKEQLKTKADTILGKVDKALQVTRAASAFLPSDLKKKYDTLAGKLQSGLSTAQGLIDRDNHGEATAMVSGALGEFSRANPAFQSVAKALPVFARVLGVNIPALGLISSIVEVGVRLGSAHYERWKLRILQAPIDAAALPVQPIDGLMAGRLFRANPVLAQAFATELNAGRDAYLAKAANDFMAIDTQALWATNTYRYDGTKERFESQDVFEQTVQAFRRLMSDNELKPYVEPEWLGQLKSYDSLVGSVDKLHKDEEAQARLDELILVTDGLHRQGQPVLQIMDNIKKELQKDGKTKP